MIGFYKGQPTDYVIKYSSGKIVREGAGLAFYYLKMNTQIVAVPMGSVDSGFVFNEVTNNFQEVTIQGQLSYRIRDPKLIATLLNFAIYPALRAYVSDDPQRLPQRVNAVVQTETRLEIQRRSLEETLRDSQAIAVEVLRRLRETNVLQPMGVEVLSLYFLSARPTPEVAKALEADYRETLLRKADEAIYARRAAAVEEERKIKEKELNRDIVLEQQRRELIALQGTNAKQEAQNRGEALLQEAEYSARASELELAAYRNLDPKTILAVGMKELGHNAGQVGNLTITSEILAALLNK
jgi:hypothetical protein